ncbi:DNA-directed RNA polymerases IV and V subunit 2 isoform X1 [Amborella trichopoda]|nr:DNA-directed RNA polymerases IV and V subunit 2 isoform X1 [Amborella trichopoda]|eukprot:XP_020519928.1 DNA-directed RNA polymerases IV and V subunit 2 isoform X1 [Amborella trichopoda]
MELKGMEAWACAARSISIEAVKMDIDKIDGLSRSDSIEELESDIEMMDIERAFSFAETSSAKESDSHCLDPATSQELLLKFCTDASSSFFKEWGLISHQLNSYNDFVAYGIHEAIRSLGEFHVDPEYNPSFKGSGWKYASVKFENVSVDRPTYMDQHGEICELKPKQARLQHITYSSRVTADVTTKVYLREIKKTDKYKTGREQYVDVNVISETKEKDVLVGRIPVMVKSNLCYLHGLKPEVLIRQGECPLDFGGYFLVKGAEKIFIAQENMCLRRLWVSKTPSWSVLYRHGNSKQKRVDVRIVESQKGDTLSGGKVINIYFQYASVPIWIMFFALGALSDKEIVQMIDLDPSDTNLAYILLSTIYDADEKCEGFRQGKNSIEYLDREIQSAKFPPKESVEECIDSLLFPSLRERKQKALYLGYMVKCLLLSYFGRRKVDNKDDFRNKRLGLAAELIEKEMLAHIKNAGRRMVKAIQRDLSADRILKPIECYFDGSIVTNGLARAFSTGNWCHPFKVSERISGVVATLKRTNPLQTMAHMRQTRLQVQYTGNIGNARYPNPSYWGKVCFLSTPDGENCGLVKNLAATGLVSTNLREPLLDKLTRCGMDKLDRVSPPSLSGKDKVFLNGEWVGLCEDSSRFVSELRNMRRNKLIHHQVEVKRDQPQHEVRIFSDAGRILRPLLIVENNKLCVSLEQINEFIKKGCPFQYLLDKRIVEFIGVEEEEDCLIAWGVKHLLSDEKNQPAQKYTHCELDLSFLLGLSCGMIPFANHNMARRVLFQSEKHSQQAIGFFTSNPNNRVDTLSHRLYYPQKPLFKTMLSECIGIPEFHNGQNAIVAVNVHEGYNQEDSIVMNRASLDRGMFRTEIHRSYKADIPVDDSVQRVKRKENEYFGKPINGFGKIDSLDDEGLPYIGASMKEGDIIIGRYVDSASDRSIKLKHTEKGIVQKVVLSANDENKLAVVQLRQVRTPCLGDKFSSMHGQKGVVGFIEAQENFPFTRQGIVPDIVINPHAFPTRQTAGQLLECALGKGICCTREENVKDNPKDKSKTGRKKAETPERLKYATPFSTASFDDITDQLQRYGFSRWGTERVYSGRTGEMQKSLIFIGPTFYQRLVHMAEDKMKFRNTGPVHPLTRQPVADRKRFGGVKFGEMERDCLIAHGAAANLHERLFVLSDFSHMFVCTKCSNMANVTIRTVANRRERGPFCRFCKSAEKIVKINVPYGAKLLYQELFSMGIVLRFETEPC